MAEKNDGKTAKKKELEESLQRLRDTIAEVEEETGRIPAPSPDPEAPATDEPAAADPADGDDLVADGGMLDEEAVYSYDAVPYTSHPFPQTHPDRLAVMATLFGLEPPDITRCRVLELGCASAGNLLPMAAMLPDAEFVGVDLSKVQIEEGRKLAGDLQLGNLDLRHGSITDVDESWGKFDFVLCHGVFSWVPDEVKESILEISAKNLNENGVAYVSYNTYPGWHFRDIIRRAMQYHTNQFEKPEVRINQSRAILRFLAQSVPESAGPYSTLLKNELNLLQRNADSYLFHEHLEDVNTPMYFHEFAALADKHGLEYLGEADLGSMLARGFPAETLQTLRRLSTDLVRGEQYMDFLRNRQFRQTLLVHKGTEVNRNIQPERLKGLRFLAASGPQQQIDLTSTTPVTFQNRFGGTMQIQRPLTKAALMLLREKAPQSVPFDELLDGALGRFPAGMTRPSREDAEKVLLQELLQCYTLRAVELHSWEPDIVTSVSDRPVVHPLNRALRAAGKPAVGPHHGNVQLGPVAQRILPELDGKHDRDALIDIAGELVRDGVLTVREKGELKTDPNQARGGIGEYVDEALKRLAGMGLLVG